METGEKLFFDTPSIGGSWGRLAHIISLVANPLFLALPTFLFISLRVAPDIVHALLWWAVIAAGVSIAPFLFIRWGVHRGHYSDPHVSIREQRFVPLLFGLGCFSLVFVSLLLLHVAVPLLATMTASLVALGIATMVTKFWKISLHLVGIAGAVTVFCVMFGPWYLFLSPLVVLVGWARWRVRAHTPLQAVAGTALAVGVAVITLWLFRL